MLKTIRITLPDPAGRIGDLIWPCVRNFVNKAASNAVFITSIDGALPKVSLCLSEVGQPVAEFVLDDGNRWSIDLVNGTGKTCATPERYEVLHPHEIITRMAEFEVLTIDHLGINLPWFDGRHPQLADLRRRLAPECLYFEFPTGAAWDFILPSKPDEVATDAYDLRIERRPKFEIVSFEKSSIPLVQLDVVTSISYEGLVDMFSEAIHDPELRNVWVYADTRSNYDLCLVLNEAHNLNDWSSFFRGHRLQI